MSTPWDAHLARLTATLPYGKCAIFGQDCTPWTSLYVFDLYQMKNLFSGFDKPDGLRENGLAIDGVKYYVTRIDDQLIVLKKAEKGAVAIKTQRTYVICSFDESRHSASDVLQSLQSFGTYLQALNF